LTKKHRRQVYNKQVPHGEFSSVRFYRAMRCSAKRGIAIACRLSVRLSVTLVDQYHTGCKSWITARTISAVTSVFVAQRPSTYNPRATWGYFGETRGGVGKSGVLEHKSGNISERRKDRRKVTVQWKTYRNSPKLFSTCTIPGICVTHLQTVSTSAAANRCNRCLQ